MIAFNAQSRLHTGTSSSRDYIDLLAYFHHNDPWDPSSLEVPDELILPSTDRTSGDTVGAITLHTKGKKQPPDYATFWECLGWLPTDTIQKMFNATTQLAGTIPLWLPLHLHIKARFLSSTNADLPKPLPQTRCSVQHLAWAALPVHNFLWESPATLPMACGLKAKALPLSKISSESTAFPIYSVTTTPRCKLVRLGTTSSINTASRPNLPNLIILNKICGTPHQNRQNVYQQNHGLYGSPSRHVVPLSAVFSTILLLSPSAGALPLKPALGTRLTSRHSLQFTFYEPIYFLDQDACFPETGERLGRFVGIAENHGDALTYWILTQDDKLLDCLVICSAVAQEPIKRAFTSTESKGSVWKKGVRGVRSPIPLQLNWI